MSDAALVAAANAGAQQAYAEIVERHSGPVYNLALRMLNNPQDAEDILQETFLSAFRALDRFEGRSQLSTWLYRIAYNAVLMRLRKRQIPTESFDEPMALEDGVQIPREFVDWSHVPDDLALNHEFRAALDTALQTLSPALRSVFVLRDIEGLSTLETAETLGLTETNTKVRLHRARLALRARINEYFSSAVGQGAR